jgi:hypothetical protein
VFAPRSTTCSRRIVLPEILEEVARFGAQLLMQAALEAEVTAFLGRDRYRRADATPDGQPGVRNGYRPVSVKTTAGPVTLERPKLRGTTAVFASRLHVTKTNALESLVIASFVRGCRCAMSRPPWPTRWAMNAGTFAANSSSITRDSVQKSTRINLAESVSCS